MFFRLKDQFQRARFNLLCRDIFRTPPLAMRDAELTFISQVSHRDLVMYLIAIKSIYRFFNAGKIVVLDDGSLTRHDLTYLRQHLPSVRLVHINDAPRGETPVGGTWERLLFIADLIRASYVVQIDSDTLTLGSISEVLDYVADGTSFTLLGAGSFPGVESMPDACRRARQNNQNSLEPQAISERSLDRFPDAAEFKYVRGCSGFAGFAKHSFTRADIEQFSRKMEVLCGVTKWREWGSEQVTSNLLVANSPKVDVLQYPKYASYYAVADVDYSRCSFLHFMGGHRFENNCYSTLAREVIRHLMLGATNLHFEQPAAMENTDRLLP